MKNALSFFKYFSSACHAGVLNFLICVLLLWAGKLHSQAKEAVLYSETYFATATLYSSFKDSLPFYFFKHTQGGDTKLNEADITEDVMLARAYVIPVPVLINGNFKTVPFEIWSNALKSQPFVPKQKTADTKALSREEKLRLEMEPTTHRMVEGEDSAQRARRIKKETEAFERTNADKGLLAPQAGPKQDSNAKAVAISDSTAMSLPLLLKQKKVPDSLISKLETMGEGAWLKWLYALQLKAGNVLFCDSTSNMPLVVLDAEQNPLDEYKRILHFWKNTYPMLWQNSNLDEHLLLADSEDAYIEKYGKLMMMGANNNGLVKKQLMKEIVAFPCNNLVKEYVLPH